MAQSFVGKVRSKAGSIDGDWGVTQVTSNKMMKSVVVTVTYLRKLPKYHVWRRFQSKIMAHDPLNELNIGDTVRIQSCRPLSKRKAFEVVQLLSRANQYDRTTKASATLQAELESTEAEERRIALQNELMSRRQFMDRLAIEQAEKEAAEHAPLIERFRATRDAMLEKFYEEKPDIAGIAGIPLTPDETHDTTTTPKLSQSPEDVGLSSLIVEKQPVAEKEPGAKEEPVAEKELPDLPTESSGDTKPDEEV